MANIAKGVYEKVLKNTTQEKLVKYIKDKNISSSLYNDYIVACDWLGLDLSDTKVLFPKDYQASDLRTSKNNQPANTQIKSAEALSGG